MKQTIDPRLGALIAIVGVLVLVGIGILVWVKPTTTPVAADKPGAVKVYTSEELANRPKALSDKSKAMFDSRREAMEGRRALMDQQRQNPNAPTGSR
jgi:hypothetical protein